MNRVGVPGRLIVSAPESPNRSNTEKRWSVTVPVPIYAHRVTKASKYEPSLFPGFAVTADTAVFTHRNGELHIVLVRRAHDPDQGRWALPGGFVEIDEDLKPAAVRELREETGLTCLHLHQIGAYGAPHRDPRFRAVTVAFWTLVDDLDESRGGDDASEAHLWSVSEALTDPSFLAFDHRQILDDAVTALGAQS